MANTNTKTTTAKKVTKPSSAKVEKKKIDTVVEEATVVESVKEVTSKPVQAKVKTELSDDTMVEVVSMVNNLSYQDTSTGLLFSWTNIGDIVDMSVRDIKTMFRLAPSMLRKMYVFIDDEDVMSLFRLDGLYRQFTEFKAIDFDDRESINDGIKIIQDMMQAYPDMKRSLLEILIGYAHDGIISDVTIIRKIETALDIKDILLNATIQ